MDDLIDRNKLLENVQFDVAVSGPRSTAKEVGQAILDVSNYIINIIKKEPTVDIELYAQWKQPSCFDEENNVFRGSNCKEEFVLISGSPKENGYEYCPHCGCKMDETIHRCSDCVFIETDCKGCVDEDETFSEIGGCENFIKKEE